MKLTCNQCGIEYEGAVDCNEMGEPNWCCRACAWENSRDGGVPKPDHTCQNRPALPVRPCGNHHEEEPGWWRRLDIPHPWTCQRCHPPSPDLYEVEYTETAQCR